MSKQQARRRAHRQPPRRESASQAERQRRPQELEKVVWVRHGAKVPGNPKIDDHATEYQYIVDAYGNRVCVCENQVVKFEAGAAGVERIEKIKRLQDSSDLWSSPPHVVLTHALRFLQQFCLPQSLDDPSDRRRLRTDITPTNLLTASGMPSSQADEVLRVLKNLELVSSRSNETTQCWFIHLVCKGIGPRFEKYSKAELIDGWALPTESSEYAPLNGGTEASDTGAEFPSEGSQEDQKEVDFRLQTLRGFYEIALRYVPEDAEVVDGFCVFTTPGPLTEIVAEELGLSKSQASMASANLNHLGIYRSSLVGRGTWRRYIRRGAEITKDHIERVRKDARDQFAERKARPKKAPKGRLEHLATAYQLVLEEVPEGLQPDEDGFVEFEANHSFRRIFCEQIESLSDRQAEELLKDLNYLGLLTTTPLMRARKPIKLRRLKVGKKITQRDIERVRRIRREKSARRPAAEQSEGDLGALGDDVYQLLSESLERIDQLDDEVRNLSGKLEERDTTITQLQQEKAELESQLAARTSGEVPAHMASTVERLKQRLGKDKK